LLLLIFFPGLALFAQTATPAGHSTLSSLQRAQLLERQRKWPEAEREFRIAHHQNPNSEAAQVGHAEALVQIHQPFDAELELQSFLRDHPNAARAHQFYAVVTLETNNDFLLAQEEMEKCVKLDPTNGMAWKSLGDIYLDHTTARDAIGAYKKARQLLPKDPLVTASLAEAYSQAGDDKQAETTFAQALKMTGTASGERARRDRAGIEYLYAQYLLRQNRPKESIAAATRALAYNPRSAVALYHRARAYKAVGDYKSAEADALQAFSLVPDGKEGPLLLADIYRKEHDLEKVQKYADLAQKFIDAEQAKAEFGREVRRLLGVAESALLKQQYQDAIPAYEELLQKVPTFYEAYFGLGICYSQTGRLQEAETAFRKYLSLQPISGDGHATLGILLLQQGRPIEAVPELEQALQIDPTLDEARKALANEYLKQSKSSAAIETLRAIADKNDVQSLTMLASAFRQEGRKQEALRQIDRALALAPNDGEALKLKQEILSSDHAPNNALPEN